ncbi:DUF6292 family protein [Saccharopolyspora sp. CA-218241]|uniref:DUF6292 family protein n=1 Tax=Saccharopolyspora sp. CA-218241 TaxID=3240027 RepID=UPI003D994059
MTVTSRRPSLLACSTFRWSSWLPHVPDRDAALAWSEDTGWSLCVETGDGPAQVLTVLVYLGQDVLPAPRVVASFVEAAAAEFSGHSTVSPRLRAAGAEDDLPHRLAAYAVPCRHAPPSPPLAGHS